MNIGDRQPDGTIYAGLSPDTSKPMFALPADAPLRKTFEKAQAYAADVHDAKGKRGFRLPSKDELNVLFNNHAAIGGFDLSGRDISGWYWSSTPWNSAPAWGQRFSDGHQAYLQSNFLVGIRAVR